MSKHDLKAKKLQVERFINKILGSKIFSDNPIVYSGDGFDMSDPNTLITRAFGEANFGDGSPDISLWDGSPIDEGKYVTHPIGDIEYMFRSLIDENITEPTLDGGEVWKLIGPISGSGSGGNPTSGIIAAIASPKVITWDTDLVPDDEEGRTYLEKHGALEYVTVQMTMPDPANAGENTLFPLWRFDEATKNILTIDNQFQKVYYTIGFGANGPSSGGGGGSMTGAEIRAALGVTVLSGDNSGDQDISGKQDKTGFVDLETPAGTINGTNATYTLANTPITGSLHLYLNGMLQDPGTGNDYTISGATITMADPLITGDKLRASYRK